MNTPPKIDVKVVVMDNAKDLDLPFYASADSAGMDLLSAITDDVVLKSGERKLIPTGLKFAIPRGYEVQVRPRSGLALKNGISLVNCVGTIDADYRGEIGVILINHGSDDFVLTRGMRIAQALIAPVYQINLKQVASLDDTERGVKGFGSTGK